MIEVHQEEAPDYTVLTGSEDLRLEGMEARMKDITRQMKQLQSAMDRVKGEPHPQQYSSNLSYPLRSASLPHIHHGGVTGLRASPLMDNLMSWKSTDGGYCQLLDNSEPRPPTTQPIQQGELSSTTQDYRSLQPPAQVAAQLLDLGESTHHSATLTGLMSEFPQLPAVQSVHHTPLAQRTYSSSLPIQHAGQHVQPGHQPAQQAPPIAFLPNQPLAPLTHTPALYTSQLAQPAYPLYQGMPQPFPTTAQHYQPPTDLGAAYSLPQTGYPPVAQPQLYQSGLQTAAPLTAPGYISPYNNPATLTMTEMAIVASYGIPKPKLPLFSSGRESDFIMLKRGLDSLLGPHRHLTEDYKYQVLLDHLKLPSAYQMAKRYIHDSTPYTPVQWTLCSNDMGSQDSWSREN